MAKKRTSVYLPGGIQGLVRDLQNGKQTEIQRDIEQEKEKDKEDEEKTADNEKSDDKPSEPTTTGADKPQSGAGEQQLAAEPTPEDNKKEEGENESENKEEKVDSDTKEYHIVKDDSKDSWQLFLDMAKQYKDAGGRLATIYIDPTLKNILDRMKYAGTEKLSTSAILSSIVARFIYDHEDEIRKVLFSGKLL